MAIVTDGQATAWTGIADLANVRVVVYAPAAPGPANRAVVAAAARPTRWTPRGEVTATVQGTVPPGGSDSTTYRIATRDEDTGSRHRGRDPDHGAGRGARPRGCGVGAVSVHAAPPERGWVGGSVEIEADELRGDDARYFAMWIGEPPAVAVDSSAGPFMRSAVDALVANGRATTGVPAAGTRGINVVAADRLTTLPALIVPPADPVRIGAANRALERAGVPWRFERGTAWRGHDRWHRGPLAVGCSGRYRRQRGTDHRRAGVRDGGAGDRAHGHARAIRDSAVGRGRVRATCCSRRR